MQDSQNVHLNPSSSGTIEAAEQARALQDEGLRRRKTQASGSGGVQFHTIFSMIDSGLESSAESLKRLPRKQSQKESESEKGSDLPVAAPVDIKPQAAEAPKEAPKAKTEQDQKPKAVTETSAKKTEALEKSFTQAVFSETKIEKNAREKVLHLERTEIKIEHRETKPVEKPKAQEKNEKRAEAKDLHAETVQDAKGQVVFEQSRVQEQGKSQERRSRQKDKDTEGSSDIREERRASDAQKGARGTEDDSARQPKIRERAEAKPAAPERADVRDPRPVERRPEETDFSDKRRADEKGSADAGNKKRSISDLEKLTGLQAKAAIETVAPIAMPVQDAGIRISVESMAKGISVESAKAPVRAAPGGQNSAGTQQHAGGADGEARSSQAQEKLGQTAKRLASYLSGKAEGPIKPEATFSDMVSKAKLFVENGRSEMTLQLKPEQLGSLKIQMVVEDGKMQAHFVTDRGEVKELIEQNADLLRNKLSEVGIEINAMSVEVRSDAGTAHPQDDRPSGLRRVTEFGTDSGTDFYSISSDAHVAYALAGMGTHLSLVA